MHTLEKNHLHDERGTKLKSTAGGKIRPRLRVIRVECCGPGGGLEESSMREPATVDF